MIQESQPWQAVLDSAGEGIWGVDLLGRCTFVNRAALAMLGCSADELVGKNMHEMIHHHHPDGSVYPGKDCNVYGVFRNNKPFTNHIDHLFRKDGTLFWTELSAQPVLDNGTLLGAVVTFRDITMSRLAEEALRRSEKLAAVGQLASSIAHEINNPLEAVTNLLYLMRTVDDPALLKTYIALAESEIARMSEITTQTLRFHRQQTSPVATNLREVLSAVVGLHASRLASRKVEVRMQLRETPTAMLLEGDIRQVLNNFIRNAYEAMPMGGVLTLRLRPGIDNRTGVPGVFLTIADTGSGLLPAIRERLFEAFQTSKGATGTGLGLWISKGILDHHQGKILIRSRQQQEDGGAHGTVFMFWLPLGS